MSIFLITHCRYFIFLNPLIHLCFKYQLLQNQMFKKVSLTILVFGLFAAVLTAPISIDFNSFQATFSQNQGLILTIKCIGGNGQLQYQFKNIPSDWKTFGNQIVVQNFSVTIRKSWRFDIYVSDPKGNYLSQTLMLNFMGAYIGLTSVTLPVTGVNTLSNNLYSPFGINNNQQNTLNNSINQVLLNQQPRIADLVNQYPGIDPLNKLTAGFGVPNDSPIAADLISTSRATYNPLRDSSIPSLLRNQKQAALNRQSQANQNISSLSDMVQKLSATINKLKQDASTAEETANNSRIAVNQCDQKLFDLQDTKTKVNNAISDKQSKVDQYNSQLSKINALIQTQTDKLATLDQLKKAAENQTMPNSKTLQNLQRTLEVCKNSLLQSTKKVEQGKIEAQTTQTQIKMLNIETNQAKTKLVQINTDLSTVRDKIVSLQSQLQEAKKQQENILKDKEKYEQVPVNNDNKVAQLLSQISNVSTNGNVAADCRIYQTPLINLQNILNKDREKYNSILLQIQDQKQTVEKLKNNLLDLKKSIGVLPMEIDTLKNQINTYDISINRTSYLCQDSVTQYSKAAVALLNTKQKLDQAQKQLDKLIQQLIKAQKQLADANNSLADISKAEAAYFNGNNSPANNIVNQNTNINNRGSSNAGQPQPQFSVGAQLPGGNSTPSGTNSIPSIDDIVKSAIDNKQKTDTSNSIRNQQTPAQPAPALVPPQTPPPATTVSPSLNFEKNSPFSISSFYSQTNNPQQSTNQPSQNFADNFDSTGSNNSPIISPPAINPLSLNFSDVISESFKLSSNFGFKSAYVGDVKGFLRKANIDLSRIAVPQNTQLYTLDNKSLNTLTVSGSTKAVLPVGTCTNPSIVDSATVTNVGLGYILAINNLNQYRLSMSDCTKVLSTSKSGSLSQGSKVFFSGTPVVIMPGNILLNAHLVVCNPNS